MTNERAELWHAVNEYAEACGGDPSKNIYGNTRRLRAVVRVEKALAALDAVKGV